MINKKLNGGFAPFLIIAIIAVLAVGGGAYAVKKNREAKVEVEGNAETQANANADANANANANANLGVNANANAKAKGSLRSLLGLGKDTQCSFTSASNGNASSGTVYISASGEMRGDFSTQASSGTQASSMIVKDGYSYFWSGEEGFKMKAPSTASAAVKAEQSMDLDSQVDYECKDWSRDVSKFSLPSGVEFVDVEAMMKIKLP